MKPELRDIILSQYLKSPEGRKKLAASMVQPIHSRMMHNALWRRALEKADVPFCEPEILSATFEADPKNLDKVMRAQDLARAQVQLLGDELLIRSVTPDEDPPQYGTGDLQYLLDDHEEFAKQPGTILINARDYADFRKWHHDRLDIESGGFCRHFMAMFGNMGIWCSRHQPVGLMLFVPRTAGRYLDTVEVEALGKEHATEEGLPTFKITLKLCLEADPSLVRAARVVRMSN